LRPRMQAELADLFIDIVKPTATSGGTKRTLVIETHSEYLLKRLRRRIAEGESISAEDVAIYFVHASDDKQSPKLEHINVQERGDFKWPAEFYAGDLEDTMEFLLRQG